MELDALETVVVEETGNFAEELIGGLWIEFREAVPPLQAKILETAFNLIIETDEDSIIPGQVASILLNEELDTAVKKQSLFVLLAVNIMYILTEMGFTFDDNYTGENQLEELCTLIQFFQELKEYEDLIGLKNLLECSDIPPVERLFQAMSVFWGENFDVSQYECMIVDVSEVALKAIKDALFEPDASEDMPATLKRRILDNKAFLVGTKAYEHVTNNGQVGGSMTAFLNFFKPYMEGLLVEGGDDVLIYAKEVLGFYIISEVNDDWLKEKATEYLYSVVSDVLLLTKIDAMIEEVVIPS